MTYVCILNALSLALKLNERLISRNVTACRL